MVNNQIGFRFTDIQIISKLVLEMPQEGISGIYYFDIRVELRVNADKKCVIPVVSINIRDEKTEVNFAKFSIGCVFEIEDFETYIKFNEQGVHEVPEHLELIFRQTSISTVRGIIYSELRGTYLHTAIMPVVFLNTFKKEEAPQI